jgi:mRNA-degrading endonuclease toxin of MazEF toxin-antitoxin module
MLLEQGNLQYCLTTPVTKVKLLRSDRFNLIIHCIIKVNTVEIKLRKCGNSIGLRIPYSIAQTCLVLSSTKYNQKRQGIVIVTLITNTLKPKIKMMVAIPTGYQVKGSVIIEQIRTLDFSSRWWETTGEILFDNFVDRVVQKLNLIIS